MDQTVVTAFTVGITSGWLAGLWMGSRPRNLPQGSYGLPPGHDWRTCFNHENTNKPSGPPPLRFRRSEHAERFIRMDEGPVQRGTGNNPTTPKPQIIPKPQTSSSSVIRVKGTFEHGGRTYGYEADATPFRENI